MIRLDSSYRAVAPEAAIARASTIARSLGITRVTDITRLDRLGLPVFASVRDCAAPGSLHVHAGKGLTPAEAHAGALMEAIEFSCAERFSRDAVLRARPRDVLDGHRREGAILDLCPLGGVSVRLDRRIPCVLAQDLQGGASALVPAELVYFPFPQSARATIFGPTTNGLASGSTQEEAVVHGLCEVIERDVISFVRLGMPTHLVDLQSLPGPYQALVDDWRGRGFDVAVRWAPNEFDLPWFAATVWERNALDPLDIAEGTGCHLDPCVAVSRALAEAAQSRLSLIHGARDDVKDCYASFEGWSVARRRRYARTLLAAVQRPFPRTSFARIADSAAGAASFGDVLTIIMQRLSRIGARRVFLVPLAPASSPVHVVRVIVPLLEHFTTMTPRIGRRLASYAAA